MAAAAAAPAAAPTEEAEPPAFRAYPSLLPDRGAEASSASLTAVAAAAGLPRGVRAVATPKVHGANMQVYVPLANGAPSATLWGRRTAWLRADEGFYGYAEAAARQGWPHKLRALAAGLALTRPGAVKGVAVFFEVYGGAYPEAGGSAGAAGAESEGGASASTSTSKGKPVQQGVWYAPRVALAAYDVRVDAVDDSSVFMDWDDAVFALRHVGIDAVPAAFRGSVADACAWASAHAADNALAHYNPLGLPLVDGNGGEGWVVRLVCEAVDSEGVRALVKIKNARFAEVATAKPTATKKTASAELALAVAVDRVADRLFTPARVAAVASKQLPADLHERNTRALAAALAADAAGDAAWADVVAEAAAVAGGGITCTSADAVAGALRLPSSPAARTWMSRAAAAVRGWLHARNA